MRAYAHDAGGRSRWISCSRLPRRQGAVLECRTHTRLRLSRSRRFRCERAFFGRYRAVITGLSHGSSRAFRCRHVFCESTYGTATGYRSQLRSAVQCWGRRSPRRYGRAAICDSRCSHWNERRSCSLIWRTSSTTSGAARRSGRRFAARDRRATRNSLHRKELEDARRRYVFRHPGVSLCRERRRVDATQHCIRCDNSGRLGMCEAGAFATICGTIWRARIDRACSLVPGAGDAWPHDPRRRAPRSNIGPAIAVRASIRGSRAIRPQCRQAGTARWIAARRLPYGVACS